MSQDNSLPRFLAILIKGRCHLGGINLLVCHLRAVSGLMFKSALRVRTSFQNMSMFRRMGLLVPQVNCKRERDY